MRILELQEYAKKHGFDSTEFEFVNLKGETKKGKWIDAYFGFFRIDGMPENKMMTTSQWRDLLGDQIFEFHPL